MAIQEKEVELKLSALRYKDMGMVQAEPNANVQELVAHIKKHGILHPLIVRPVGDMFEVLDGLARWKAAIILGLETVPAIIRPLNDNQARETRRAENSSRGE